MRLGNISEIVVFKMAEFFTAVISAAVLFSLFPGLAYVSKSYRSWDSNFFGSFFVLFIFYFLLLYGPISIYAIIRFDRMLCRSFRTPIMNAISFFIYAFLLSYSFSQRALRVEVIVSILLLSIAVFVFGTGYIAVRNRLSAN